MILPFDSWASEPGAWRARAAAVVPGGASTGSKRPAAQWGEDEPDAPTHFVRASGCRVTTTEGVELVDCTMALGAVALGYADPGVVRAVQGAAAAGNVAGLSPRLEVELAERLCAVIPCAERVRFLKTGAEAVAAAVRIARTATGRHRVVGWGYFGWLDWWTDAPGVPDGAHADYEPVPYGDMDALRIAAERAGAELAAIVLEPVVERLPDPAWIQDARALCERLGAVLVLDEIKTGFRLRPGGWHELAGVQPHLAVFGKALANGFPLAAVVGDAAVMAAASRTWISSTLASETCALAAASAVLDRHESEDVCASLWARGTRLGAALGRAIAGAGVPGVRVDGIPPMLLLRWDDADAERRFVQAAARHGALLKRGAYDFASLAHDDAAVATVERAVGAALADVAAERAR
jgi:glutamate-1-semialdehyde 2,1-aminomutase